MSQGPRHIAMIMDGNGRWAQQRGLPRVKGHEAGADTVRRIVRASGERGIEALTLYSFSTENWSRPAEEVDSLMTLLAQFLVDEAQELMENKVRLRGIGELERLPKYVRVLLQQAEALTADNDGLLLTLALSYGSRTEIVHAIQDLAGAVQRGELAPEQITEQHVTDRLYTAGVPDPDLVVRTSGEMRLSNFLLWQVAYAEIYVTEVMWPDFDVEHLDEAIAAFGSRERRFGKTSKQLEEDEAC